MLTICVSSYGQKKDTVVKRDTAYVPTYVRTDTLRRNFYYLQNGSPVVYFAENGYLIIAGYSTRDQQGKWLQWTQEPQIVGVLDEKKKPARKVIQILQ